MLILRDLGVGGWSFGWWRGDGELVVGDMMMHELTTPMYREQPDIYLIGTVYACLVVVTEDLNGPTEHHGVLCLAQLRSQVFRYCTDSTRDDKLVRESICNLRCLRQ